jgi:hypothetical protein
MSEPELSRPMSLCTADGRLDRAAVGWSRHPLHRCNLAGHRLRKKRWDYWSVLGDDGLFNITIADVDYLGLAVCSFVDFASGDLFEKACLLPLGFRLALGDSVGGDVVFDVPGMHLALLGEGEDTRLRADGRTLGGRRLHADLRVVRPRGHETLNVVVPWSDERFQFTSKQTCLPVAGEVVIDGRRREFGGRNHAFACHDFGRGVWPRDTGWNWAVASGSVDGRTVGWNLGGGWTRGTGMTENGLCLDGRIHKIEEEVDWRLDAANPMEPWQLGTPIGRRIDLTFTPFWKRTMGINLGVLSARLLWAVGRFSGAVVDDGGNRLAVNGLLGTAEDFQARW